MLYFIISVLFGWATFAVLSYTEYFEDDLPPNDVFPIKCLVSAMIGAAWPLALIGLFIVGGYYFLIHPWVKKLKDKYQQ